MPQKFSVKEFTTEAVYHIYNRGIEGTEVFRQSEDFEKLILLSRGYLDDYTPTPIKGYKDERPYLKKRRRAMNLKGEVEVLAYCLMQDHFHLLLWQREKDGISKFMRRLMTAYGMYFNKKYGRRGSLFEGIYKAVAINPPEDVLAASRYIHLKPVARTVSRFGPLTTVTGSRPEEYLYSTYRYYAGEETGWINLQRILDLAGGVKAYRSFVEDGPRSGNDKAYWMLSEGSRRT